MVARYTRSLTAAAAAPLPLTAADAPHVHPTRALT